MRDLLNYFVELNMDIAAEKPTIHREIASPPSDINSDIRLQARFWQSPFAVCAAAVVAAQVVITGYGLVSGKPIPVDVMSALTLLSVSMLSAGIWPTWNFLNLGKDGIEQQIGLTSVKVDWDHIKSVDAFDHGLEVRYVNQTNTGAQIVKAIQIPNRYGVTADRFADLMEAAWQENGRTVKVA
ncbi:MAG: hypothetical protein AAF603_05330 [Pseudomonadota bacterium]